MLLDSPSRRLQQLNLESSITAIYSLANPTDPFQHTHSPLHSGHDAAATATDSAGRAGVGG